MACALARVMTTTKKQEMRTDIGHGLYRDQMHEDMGQDDSVEAQEFRAARAAEAKRNNEAVAIVRLFRAMARLQ